MEAVMNCTRCGGFIIPEAFRDIGFSTIGWRCLLCGEIVDQVILKNRAQPSAMSPMDEDPTDWQSSAEEYEWGAMT